MRTLLRFVALPSLLLSTAVVHAQNLYPGSPAPALSVKTWYKGTPVTKFAKDKTYVVEFWATWCGPCRDSIPHLTELAKKNKSVTFVGVSIWEDDKGDNIKKFVTEMGKKMDYNVGYSGNKTGMSKTWMEAAGQNGIPTAFVVKNQHVMWIGHPMDMDKPLKEIVAGKFDLAAFKKDYAKKADAARAEMAAQKRVTSASELVKAGKYEEATKLLDSIEKENPQVSGLTAGLRLQILGKTDMAAWETKAKAMATGTEDDKSRLAIFALQLAQSKSDMDLAQKAVDLLLADAKEEDVMSYYYAATFYSMVPDFAKALEQMDKALVALPKSSLKDNPQADKALKQIREEYAKKAKG